MPTTIPLPTSSATSPNFTSLNNLLGLGILMVWAIVMLSIGAAVHFGLQFAGVATYEQLALF